MFGQQVVTCFFCKEVVNYVGDENFEPRVRMEVYNPEARRSVCLNVYFAHDTCWKSAEGSQVQPQAKAV